jgi:hypothetical protein
MVSTGTTTVSATKHKNNFGYFEGTTGIEFLGTDIIGINFVDVFKEDALHFLDFVSDQPKVLIPISMSFYHFYHDFFGAFLTQYELMPDAKYIIDITVIKDISPLPSFLKLFFKFLNDNKVDYESVDFGKTNKININNFYYTNLQAESSELNDPALKIYNMSQNYVKDVNVLANRKIFLSRKNFQNRDLSPFINERLPFQNDNRIDDEKKAEEYFKTLGFEVVIPENFKNFEEQINYMYEAKTIISYTGSGLTNAFFMRPGSTVIELVTPLISFSSLGNGVTEALSNAQEEIHHFYHLLAQSMNHKYIGIRNKERSIDKIIETIESDKALKLFLES